MNVTNLDQFEQLCISLIRVSTVVRIQQWYDCWTELRQVIFQILYWKWEKTMSENNEDRVNSICGQATLKILQSNFLGNRN